MGKLLNFSVLHCLHLQNANNKHLPHGTVRRTTCVPRAPGSWEDVCVWALSPVIVVFSSSSLSSGVRCHWCSKLSPSTHLLCDLEEVHWLLAPSFLCQVEVIKYRLPRVTVKTKWSQGHTVRAHSRGPSPPPESAAVCFSHPSQALRRELSRTDCQVVDSVFL